MEGENVEMGAIAPEVKEDEVKEEVAQQGEKVRCTKLVFFSFFFFLLFLSCF
jgi:hypothetical protein